MQFSVIDNVTSSSAEIKVTATTETLLNTLDFTDHAYTCIIWRIPYKEGVQVQ